MTLPVVNMVGTGANIKRLLKENGMTIKELQLIFGFSTPQAIYKWIHGRNLPTIDNLVCLAAIFNVTIDDILVVEKEVT